MTRSESTVARFQIAKENEMQVLAESAFQIERLVAWIRLATFVMMGTGGFVASHWGAVAHHQSIWRRLIILAYLCFTLGTILYLRRVRPSATRAIGGEIFKTFVDYAFFISMGLMSWKIDGEPPTAGPALFALLLAFSIGRYSWLNVVLSAVLSSLGFLIEGWYAGTLVLLPALRVLFAYLAMAGLFVAMNVRIRAMFLNLRRMDNLRKFFPREVADRVMDLGDSFLAPVQREATVLFSDIRGFTAMSEHLPPQAVLAFLDEYFGHMTHLVKAHGGIVNKFIGDGMLALWGVPHQSETHAEQALKAALDMRRTVEELNDVRRRSNAPEIRIGIGIHTGTVAAGMLGGADQHEYTVIGDSVNLASRIETLTKKLGADILVSQSTWEQAGIQFEGRQVSEEHVPGRGDPVTVYALQGRRANPPSRSA